MSRGRTTDAALVVYGTNAVAELLRSRAGVHRVVRLRGRDPGVVETLAGSRGLAIEEADRGALDRLAGTPHHQGVVALAAPFAYAALEDLLGAGSVLVLDSLQDPRNLGAILRTARAAGAGGVVLPKDRSVGVTPVVVAASAGCLFGMPLARVPNLARALEDLKNAGFWLIGLMADGERSLYELPPIERPALVVGGEGAGLRPLVRRCCDFDARLPMAPGVESLNASVAAGIALYEVIVRSRRGS